MAETRHREELGDPLERTDDDRFDVCQPSHARHRVSSVTPHIVVGPAVLREQLVSPHLSVSSTIASSVARQNQRGGQRDRNPRTGVLAAIDKLMVLQDGRLEHFGPRDEVIRRLNGPALRQTAAA